MPAEIIKMIRLPPMLSLIAFEAAARHGSFLGAAEELCISPSAVSHRIKTLENWLGLTLFERSNRHIALTGIGESYLADIRQALRMVETASFRIRKDDHRQIRLSVAPGIGSAWLVNHLNDYRAAQPSIEFLIVSSTTAKPLAAGETDVSLLYGTPPWPGAEAFELYQEAIFPVCAPTMAEQLGSPASPRELNRFPLLRHPLLPWKPWLSAADMADFSDRLTYGPSFDDAVMLLEAAAAGAGIALTVNLPARPYLLSGALVRPFDISIPGQGFHAVVPHHAFKQPWVRQFVRWLQTRARQIVTL